jgi:hypothetical protein
MMSARAAEKLFRAFHRRKPQKSEVVSIGMEGTSDALVVGRLDGVMYSVKGKKTGLVHEFKGRKPTLLVSADGKQMFIVGPMKFTSRGFVP